MEETRKPTYEELLVENTQLKQEVADLKNQCAVIPSLEAQIVELKAQVDTLTKMLFGKKSEKSKKSKEQSQELAETESQVNNESPVEEPKRKRKKNGGGGRKSFPSEIPRRDIHVSLQPDECCCPNCGKNFEPMGVEVTEVLNFIPMVLEVLRFIRERMKAT
jgi:transposase